MESSNFESRLAALPSPHLEKCQLLRSWTVHGWNDTLKPSSFTCVYLTPYAGTVFLLVLHFVLWKCNGKKYCVFPHFIPNQTRITFFAYTLSKGKSIGKYLVTCIIWSRQWGGLNRKMGLSGFLSHLPIAHQCGYPFFWFSIFDTLNRSHMVYNLGVTI